MLYTHLIGCYIHARTQHECMYPYHTNTHTHTHTHILTTVRRQGSWRSADRCPQDPGDESSTLSPPALLCLYACVYLLSVCMCVCIYTNTHTHPCVFGDGIFNVITTLSPEKHNEIEHAEKHEHDLYHVTCITWPVSRDLYHICRYTWMQYRDT